MQEPSKQVQILTIAYHVERMQGGQRVRHLSCEMLLVHRMDSAPRGTF
jgi:hypothetical protein